MNNHPNGSSGFTHSFRGSAIKLKQLIDYSLVCGLPCDVWGSSDWLYSGPEDGICECAHKCQCKSAPCRQLAKTESKHEMWAVKCGCNVLGRLSQIPEAANFPVSRAELWLSCMLLVTSLSFSMRYTLCLWLQCATQIPCLRDAD